MIISPKYKFVFCHVPKVAGSSITVALCGYGLRCATRDATEAPLGSDNQHVTMQQLKNSNILSANDFDEYFKFCFVRNPWARLVSMYHWHQGEHFKKHHFNMWNFATNNDFIDWARARVPRGIRQLLFIADAEGNLLVDKVYRFENLVEDFNELRIKLGLPDPNGDHTLNDTTLYKFNRSRHKHYTECYSNEIIDLVAEYAEEEIKLFNYTFDGS